ncbi:MAG: hypothetical protein ACYCZ6_16920, partial [Polaromonas sp.]
MANDHVVVQTHQVRRGNLYLLLREFTEEQIALGVPAKGIEGAFALYIGVSAVTLSHIKGRRNISDKLAHQIEANAGKENGWMDSAQSGPLPTPAETAFLAFAQNAWRS